VATLGTSLKLLEHLNNHLSKIFHNFEVVELWQDLTAVIGELWTGQGWCNTVGKRKKRDVLTSSLK
jgi:hypothetical protein